MDKEVKRRRKAAGQYVQQCRKAVGLTQKELADRLNYSYFTTISQVESGAMRIPIDSFQAYADALQVDPRRFATKLIELYEPTLYNMLFRVGSTKEESELDKKCGKLTPEDKKRVITIIDALLAANE